MAGYHGGFGGGFGGANLNALMRQAQKLQEDMQKQKEQLETTEFSSNIGGGQVELVMFGSKKSNLSKSILKLLTQMMSKCLKI